MKKNKSKKLVAFRSRYSKEELKDLAKNIPELNVIRTPTITDIVNYALMLLKNQIDQKE